MPEELIDLIRAQRPGEVVTRAGEAYLTVAAALALLDEAEQRGIRVLGMEGFLVDEVSDTVFPALGRVTDFAGSPPSPAVDAARRLLNGPWATSPTPDGDQIHPEARGRHMVVVVLGDRSG